MQPLYTSEVIRPDTILPLFQIPNGTGSLDVMASFLLVPGVRGFGVSVRSGTVRVEVVSVALVSMATGAGSGYRVVVDFYAGPQGCVSIRGKPPCTAPPSPPPPINATLDVLVRPLPPK